MTSKNSSNADSYSGAPKAGAPLKKILVHMCCGPCSIIPLKNILKEEFEVHGYFYNPNIHPRGEFEKRLNGTKELAAHMGLDVLCDEEYRAVDFIRGMIESVDGATDEAGNPPEHTRCTYCYADRLEATAKAAKVHGYQAFTSSLLYSKYQNHAEIIELAEGIAAKYGVEFFYRDFREGWVEGIEKSKEIGLYRQKYCGCVYSLIDRYPKKYKKKRQAKQ
ncbi:MAG: epoxyqueuosine reductase QueH [Proteobacteria bacterium]|nr:epoxyqueuosine reductase QueH [Pseudomonadota bacterium]